MAKMRMPEHKPSAPQVQPLEELLWNGEAALYKQACWSIANRGTEILRPANLITSDGGDEEEYRAGGEIPSYPESVKNVERCLGMRTCGEAVALFEEKNEVEPTGECPHGHQDAAFAFMMGGIRPTEPCSQCGEKPEFGNTVMSPGFYSNGPVS